MERRCGTCHYWPAKLSRIGRRIYSGEPMHECRAPLPAAPVLPEAVTGTSDWVRFKWPPRALGMHADEGTECPYWHNWRDPPPDAGMPASVPAIVAQAAAEAARSGATLAESFALFQTEFARALQPPAAAEDVPGAV